MRSSFKRIGAYVQQVNARNTGLSVTNLQGVSINKYFMPSVANVNGTDLSNYKVVSKEQFAYNPMHVGRDEVLPVAMLETDDPVIVSPAYVVFEIIDKQALLPEYLMMWCRRPEFDRNAWFTTDSSVRGGFNWDDFCEMTLPVPSPEKQREIVKEYHTIVDRIKLNEQLNQKLEETAQAIYKQWFVDFEFPISAKYAAAIGKPELEGKPYKSSGGEMEFNKALEQEIPYGWLDTTVEGVSKKIVCGKTPLTSDPMNFGEDIPFVTIPDMHDKVYVVKTNRYLSKKGAATQKNTTLPKNSVCVSCIASPGLVVLTSEESQTNQQINSVVCNNETSHFFAYFALSDLGRKIKEWGIKGSVGANMSKSEFSAMKILEAPTDIQQRFHKIVEPVFIYSLQMQQQQEMVLSIQQLVNARMVLGR